jgi:hypothetical protein
MRDRETKSSTPHEERLPCERLPYERPALTFIPLKPEEQLLACGKIKTGPSCASRKKSS